MPPCFTKDWFTPHVPLLTRHILPLAGTPELHVLEIGSFEGRSACWFLENILTHPTSTMTCVDTFEGSDEHDADTIEHMEMRFDANIRSIGATHKVQKHKGDSRTVLRTLPLEHYDVIYIDGSHLSMDVLHDAVLSWGLLRTGGLLLFDDYQWNFYEDERQNPKEAIDAFLNIFAPALTIIEQGWQVLIQKRSSHVS